jgi:hypothetical protein
MNLTRTVNLHAMQVGPLAKQLPQVEGLQLERMEEGL